MRITLSFAPVVWLFVTLWRSVLAVVLGAVSLTGIGAILLNAYGLYGYSKEVTGVESGDCRGRNVTKTTLLYTPNLVTWAFGGSTKERRFYSTKENRFWDENGRSFTSENIQNMENAFIVSQDKKN